MSSARESTIEFADEHVDEYRHVEQDFKLNLIYPGDGSTVYEDFDYVDHIENYNESSIYVSGMYDFGKGTINYYWICVSYTKSKKVFIIAKRYYTFDNISEVRRYCRCNKCANIFTNSTYSIMGFNKCNCCNKCLKEDIEDEYLISEHLMKKTIDFISTM